jgi:hypothetical protein
MKTKLMDAFRSISVYNAKRYFEPNREKTYSVNNLTAKKSADGSVAIQYPPSDLRSLFVDQAIEVTEENAVWIIFVAEVCQSFPVFG